MDLSKCTDEQRESIVHVDGGLFIAAGAGSGKTFTLQNRIAYALSEESGPKLSSVDEVLAITFMEKAAAEIKARVRSALRAEGKVEEALKVDASWISTIHGMCSRILHEYALEAGLDPAFVVLSEFDEKQLRTCAIEEVLHAEQESIALRGARASKYAALFEEYGVVAKGMGDVTVLSMLETLLAKAASFEDGLGAVRLCPVEMRPGDVARKLLSEYETAWSYAQGRINPKKPQKGLSEALAACETGVELLNGYLLDSDDVAGLADVLSRIPVFRVDALGRGDDDKDVARSALRTLDWALRNVNAMLARPHLDTLLALAEQVDAVYQGMLDELSALDNNGLLRRTHALLNKRPDIAEGFRSRFKLVMVDEFQDTNQMQVDLIKKVAGEQSLCTVGDAQQSIYRFNGADVAVFNKRGDAVDAEIASGGSAKRTQLNANFRSHGDILAFVRRVCGQQSVFGDRFLDLQARREERGFYKGKGSRIEVQLISYEGNKDACGVVEAEAAAIADRFSTLRDVGHEPGEMVVLVGTTKNVDVYASALRDRGFECILGGGRSFFELPEVQLVRDLLTALANPADSEALFSALSGPMLHLSAEDFLTLATRRVEADGDVGADVGSSVADSRVLRRRRMQDGLRQADRSASSDSLRFALALFDRAFSRVRTATPSKVLLDMLVESGWFARLEEEGARGTSVAANVLKALRMVEELEAKPGYELARVARDFRAMSASVKTAPASLSVENQNAVRLMTVHKSKGLEFPIVAVASYEPWERCSDAFSMTTDDGEIFVSMSAKESKVLAATGRKLPCGYACDDAFDPRVAGDAAQFACAIRNLDWREEVCEAQRKFYVACTRASEYLLISGLLKTSKSGESYGQVPILDDVRSALMGPFEGLPESSCELDYGGSRPLRYARSHYTKDSPFGSVARMEQADEGVAGLQVEKGALDSSSDADASSGSSVAAAPSGSSAADASSSSSPTVMRVPVLTHDEPLALESASRRRNVFSYSSIAPREDHLPVEERDDLSVASAAAQMMVAGFTVDEEEAVEDVDLVTGAMPLATDVGSAFHRICQLAIVRAGEPGRLTLPSTQAVDAVARTYRIEGAVRERLDRALVRWFASDIAQTAAGYGRMRAEVPFMVAMRFGMLDACVGDDRTGQDAPDESAVRYLEGEIDLLAEAADGSHALVVDYKTGGSQEETSERLHTKHLLQASCYAYALLLTREYERVDFAFVRVEREDATLPDQPQVVRYSFARGDLEMLRRRIEEAYLAAGLD